MRNLLLIFLFSFAGCASRTPIDRAAALNKSISSKAASLSRFAKYTGVEDEQSQIKEAIGQTARDIGLVRDCLKHRGGIANPICRADAYETENRVIWITASASRAMDDVDHNPKASEGTKRKAHKMLASIQGGAEKTDITLDRGGLLVRRTFRVRLPQKISR
jgi:hypothetical protein